MFLKTPEVDKKKFQLSSNLGGVAMDHRSSGMAQHPTQDRLPQGPLPSYLRPQKLPSYLRPQKVLSSSSYSKIVHFKGPSWNLDDFSLRLHFSPASEGNKVFSGRVQKWMVAWTSLTFCQHFYISEEETKYLYKNEFLNLHHSFHHLGADMLF